MKVHLFDHEQYLKFPKYHEHKINATKCGYVREIVTTKSEEVTCKLCLKKVEIKI